VDPPPGQSAERVIRQNPKTRPANGRPTSPAQVGPAVKSLEARSQVLGEAVKIRLPRTDVSIQIPSTGRG